MNWFDHLVALAIIVVVYLGLPVGVIATIWYGGGVLLWWLAWAICSEIKRIKVSGS